MCHRIDVGRRTPGWLGGSGRLESPALPWGLVHGGAMSPLLGEEEEDADRRDAGAEHLVPRQGESWICLWISMSNYLGVDRTRFMP